MYTLYDIININNVLNLWIKNKGILLYVNREWVYTYSMLDNIYYSIYINYILYKI